MLDQFIPSNLYAFFLVFARVGTVMLLLPGFGESYVSPRIRLLLALALTVIVAPIVASTLPTMPASPFALAVQFALEITIGFFLGMAVRIMISALQVAGTVLAFQASLANALVMDPASAQQGAITNAFLSTAGVVLIFATNLHHVLLTGIIDSYVVFKPTSAAPIADMSEATARLVAKSFVLAMQLAAPFIVVGLLFTLGIGLLNRLMPQVQIFFVAMPLQIALGFFVLLLTGSAILMWWLGAFETQVRALFGSG